MVMVSTLARRLVVVVVLGLALGHLWSVNQYQSDRMDVAIATHALEPRNETNGMWLMSRKLMAAIVATALVCIAVLAATRAAEAIVLIVAGYAALGLALSAERADLGYAKAAWPLMPWAPKQPAGVMCGVFLIILGACVYMVWREAVARIAGEEERKKEDKQKRRRRSGEPRKHTVHRMRPKPKAEPVEEDQRAGTED